VSTPDQVRGRLSHENALDTHRARKSCNVLSVREPNVRHALTHLMAGHSVPPGIVWFRDDLRLCDHPTLHAASKTGAPVICLYVFDEASDALCRRGARPLGGAARWWLAQSLRALQNSLNAVGASLVLRKGPAAPTIAGLARETPAGKVFWNAIAQAPHQTVANQVAAALETIGVAPQSFAGDLLAAPGDIRTKEGRGLRVFTPFWRRVQNLGDPPQPLLPPKTLRPIPDWQAIRSRNGIWNPRIPTGPGVCANHGSRARSRRWPGSTHFLKAAWPAMPATATGPIAGEHQGCRCTCASARSVRGRSGTPPRFAAAERPALAGDVDKYLSELGWRELCRHLVFDAPGLALRNLQPSFDAFPWQPDDKALVAWQSRQPAMRRRCRTAGVRAIADGPDPPAMARSAARTQRRGRGTWHDLSGADHRSQSGPRTRAESLCEGARDVSTPRHPLYTPANPAIVASLTTLGDDMDDEKPDLEPMPDAMSSDIEAPKEAKPAVKKRRKTAAKKVAKKVAPKKKAKKAKKAAKKSAAKKSTKKTGKKAAKKTAKKAAKKKRPRSRSARL
jgi:hypothetical protein